jgi:hypothetical protein
MKYVIQKAEKSTCPKCGLTVDLLAPEINNGPIFYICWPCKIVAQAGVGPVEVVG